MPRWTIGHLMLGVLGLAVVLAAGRIDLALGSFTFGLISIAAYRTNQQIVAARAVGRGRSRLALAGHFVGSLVVAAASLGTAFVGVLITFLILLPPGGGMPTSEALAAVSVLSIPVGLGLLRFSRWFVRNAVAELPAPMPQPPTLDPPAEAQPPSPLASEPPGP